MADLHIGGWQDSKMKELGLQSFKLAIDRCIQENVSFILFAGDLFNTALPQIDLIKEVAGVLRKVKDNKIPIYCIAGSHDFSPSGKTMLDVLEKAGLLTNVVKFDNEGNLQFTEINDNLKITGLLGKKGGLEKSDYETLNKSVLESEPGKKIFMFHTAINEFKPRGLEDMDGQDVASLPNNFHYYAGGHVHYIFQKEHGQGYLTFPGALFPNNFKELEEFKHGGFYLVDENFNPEYIPIKIKDVVSLNFDADNKTPENLQEEILTTLNNSNLEDKIVLLRLKGILISGKPSDIKFNKIINSFPQAYYITKNISKLTTKKFKETEVKQGTVEEVEQQVIKEHSPSFNIPEINEEDITQILIDVLNKEKNEGEKNADFEKRIFSEAKQLLNLNEIFK
jgi:hypothetical protein